MPLQISQLINILFNNNDDKGDDESLYHLNGLNLKK